MPDQVVLFVDAQNVYRRARGAFFAETDPSPCGQIDPVALGNLICSRPPSGITRFLKEVRVYTGRPDSSKEPKTYGAHMRQCAAWQRAGATVIAHPLRYPGDWPRTKPQEKGIDVALAIDFVTGAVDGTYDVGVIFSTDTDLRPALEFVALRYNPYPRGEVAAWSSPTSVKRLSIHQRNIWCHYLSRADYDAIPDLTDYNL